MFDYESLDGLRGFRDVRLETFPVSEDQEQHLLRAAYSGTHNFAHIEGVVLVAKEKHTSVIRQIHLYQSSLDFLARTL